MIIAVDAGGSVQVQDVADTRRFHVEIDSHPHLNEEAASLVTIDGDVAWVSIEVLKRRPELADDEAALVALDAMIAKARPHGWIDDERAAIRAHIVRAGGTMPAIS